MPIKPIGFDDYGARRQLLLDKAAEAVGKRFPISNENYSIELHNIGYENMKPFSKKEEKEAILSGKSLNKRLKGVWVLKDAHTGAVIDKSAKRTILNVPWLTNRGTFVRNGTEHSLSNQLRLVPGVFSKWTTDGRIESHVNVAPGTGHAFKVSFDPASAEFSILARNRKIKLYPVLNAIGVPDSMMEEAWGKDILNKNKVGEPLRAVKSAFQTFGTYKQMNKTAADTAIPATEPSHSPTDEELGTLKQAFAKMELDPHATKLTLGQAHAFVTPALFMDSTNKLLRMSRDQEEADDRDSMAFQRLHMAHDHLYEKLIKDPGHIAGRLLWKASNKRTVQNIPSGALDKHVDSMFTTSGLGQALEEISPTDSYDQAHRITRMGEGAMANLESVPDEARSVQSTYAGFIDPVRSPQSLKVGVDMRLAHGAAFSDDGRLYRRMLNTKTGKRDWVDSVSASDMNIATPESLTDKNDFVPTFRKGKGLGYIHKKDVDYVIEHPHDLFSTMANMVPNISAVKGMRLLMGSAYHMNALPLAGREAPLVRAEGPGGEDMHKFMAKYVGAVNADVGGVVQHVSRDKIDILGEDGKVHTHELYHNFPYARKTSLTNYAKVQPGDKVKAGQLLATSNFTDDKGLMALGSNLRVAYIPYRGSTFEDGIVISESAANKLSSEEMKTNKLRDETGLEVGGSGHMSLFPGRFNTEQRKKIGADGVIKVGQTVQTGDPLILAIKNMPARIGSMGRRTTHDFSVVWEAHDPGVVTDARKTKGGWRVQVRANSPLRPADKLAIRQGGKGVIADVLPDAHMPRDKDGRPFEVLLSPMSITSRTNPSALIETVLGKVAAKTGKAYVLPPFSERSWVDIADEELAKNKMSANEDVYDPVMDKVVPKVLTGVTYVHKLQQTAEAKSGGRSFGAYTLDEQPATGGHEGGKRLGSMECAAIMSYPGAGAVLRDAKLIRGQANHDYWRDVKLGKNPAMPRSSFIFDKFLSQVQASGVNLKRDGSKYNIFAMTNDQAHRLTGGREIKSPDTYDAKRLEPIKGGLFDEELTGGTEGTQFSHITLDEPVPNPVTEGVMRRILGATEKDFDKWIGGEVEYKGKKGGDALKQRLKDINIDQEITRATLEAQGHSQSKRDNAIKRLRALMSMKEHGITPDQFMLDRVPVLPPRYRPIVATDDMNLANDANYLYRELMFARDDYRNAKETLPEDQLTEPRARIYRAFRAVTGLGDPDSVELREKNVGGILKAVFGKGSAKFGQFQRRMLGIPVDLSARSVIRPDPNLRMDQVGLPENRAWELYEPFIVRSMVREGVKATDAAKAVSERSPEARKHLVRVVKERPVIINRAPTLHRWGIMGAWPVLIHGDSMSIPPIICKGFGADFDGDTLSMHVPVSNDAVKEVTEKMMPQQNLFGARDFSLMFAPSQEYVHAAHILTRNPARALPKVFNTEDDAVHAYKKGEISADDPIKILKRNIQ